VPPVDLVGLEVGYRLIPLVDRSQGGQLMGRIKGVRRKLSQELGFLIQPVHIRDNLDLDPNQYRIALMGVTVGEGEVFPDQELAINPGRVFGQIQGTATKDPTFGLDAVWIDPANREQAQGLGYTVVDAGTVVATHLSQLLKEHAHEMLGTKRCSICWMCWASTRPSWWRTWCPRPQSGGGAQGHAEPALRSRSPCATCAPSPKPWRSMAPRVRIPAF
jgi:flagellar biosynthesis component FlhA